MRFLKKSLLFLLAIIGAAVGWLLVTQSADSVADTGQNLDLAHQTRFIRWVLLGSIIIFWSDLIEFLGRKRLSAEQIMRAKAMQWRVAGAIVAFEILVVESVFQYAF